MTVTLSEWLRLDALRKQALKALGEFDTLVFQLWRHYSPDEPEYALMCRLHGEILSAGDSLTIDTTVQSEWMGGSTEGPGSENTKTYLREPHSAGRGSCRRYFTAREVDDARRAGLLTTGPDVTGPKE